MKEETVLEEFFGDHKSKRKIIKLTNETSGEIRYILDYCQLYTKTDYGAWVFYGFGKSEKELLEQHNRDIENDNKRQHK